MSTAHATYSVVGTDSKTKQVGAVGGSCVPNLSILDAIFASAPGKGVVVAQANPNVQGRTTAISLLGSKTPQEIITQITSNDSLRADRQFGIADLVNPAARTPAATTLRQLAPNKA